MSPAFALLRRVHFHETDMAGVMYFANYFRLMEEVEQAFFRSLGFAVALDLSGTRTGFPRVNVQCEYFEPARFDEELSLELHVTRLGAKSMTYEVDFVRAGKRIARGRITGVCCIADGGGIRSIPIPAEIVGKLRPFVRERNE